MEQIPYIAHESQMARMERTNRRVWILCIILVACLIGTNAGWVYYESQYVDTEVSQEIDTGNGDATVIGVGDYHGTGETDR